MRQEGTVVLVAPTAEIVAQEEAESLAQIKMRELKETLRSGDND